MFRADRSNRSHSCPFVFIRGHIVRLVALVLAGLELACARGRDEGELTVAVAANALPVMEELARAFSRETGVGVTLSSGSSGALARQAREGAPFDLLVSADMERVEELARDGVIDPDGVAPYARGVLVLWQPAGARPRLGALDELSSPAASRMRVALASPVHAPYGAAARSALERRRLWKVLEGRVVFGEDVGQVLQMARSGNVDAAFLPLSLVQGRKDGQWIEVPEELLPVIRQGLGVMKGSQRSREARRFREFLLGREAQEVFLRHGYRPAR